MPIEIEIEQTNRSRENMPHVPNAARLIEIANMSQTALTLMTDLGSRERHRPFSDIKRQKQELIRKDYKIVEGEANMFWRLLEQEGFGVIMSSSKGKPEKFVWNYNLKEIAAIALEEKTSDPAVVAVDPVAKNRETAVFPKVIAKVADKPVVSTPRIVTLAKERLAKSEGERISQMATQTFGSAAVAKPVQNNPISLNSTESKTVVVPIRQGEVDIEIKMPSDVTKEEIEMAIRVLIRRMI